MSGKNVIAYCKKGHKLAELAAVEGVAVVHVAGAVPGRSMKPRGQFNIAREWLTVALKSDGAHALHSLYCESCSAEYFGTPAQLVAEFQKTRRAVTLAPLNKNML